MHLRFNCCNAFNDVSEGCYINDLPIAIQSYVTLNVLLSSSLRKSSVGSRAQSVVCRRVVLQAWNMN